MQNFPKISKMLDEVLFFSTLALSISMAYYYKSIESREKKKKYATGLGILIAFLICGHHLYHIVLMVWLNVIILKSCDKRYVHLMSLAYTWTHLVYLHHFLSNAHYVILLHQSVALRLVGLAFEINTANHIQITKPPPPTPPTKTKKKSKEKIVPVEPVVEEKKETDENECVLKCTTGDMLAYAFFFIGLHQGPYFRYRVYLDHLKLPLSSIGDFRRLTEHKLRKTTAYVVAYLLLRVQFPTEMYYEESFYKWDSDIRFLYNIPVLMMFVIRQLIITLLCTCACTEAGFGIYPADTKPIPGHGPSAKFSLLKLPEENPPPPPPPPEPVKAMKRKKGQEEPEPVEEVQEEVKEVVLEYNFSMLKCFHKEKLMIGPRMIDTVRSWNIPTRYWFRMNIHKNMLNSSNEMRSACSFLVWTLWDEASLQTLIISCTLWVYIHIESEYSETFNIRGREKVNMAWEIGFSVMRMFCLIYLTPCLIIKDDLTLMKYYDSVSWVFHWVLFGLAVGAIISRKDVQIEEIAPPPPPPQTNESDMPKVNVICSCFK